MEEMTLGLQVSSRGPWGPRLPQDGPSLPPCPLTCELLLESDHILQAGEGPRPHLRAGPHLEEVPSVALKATHLSTEDVSWEAGGAGRAGLWVEWGWMQGWAGSWTAKVCSSHSGSGFRPFLLEPQGPVALSLLIQPLERLGRGRRVGKLLPQYPWAGALTLRGEQGPLVLGLGVVVAVQDQILHDLPIGLRGGAPVQQNGGRRQGAQAQVRWGRRGSWGAEEEKGRGGITGSPSPGAVVRQGVRSWPFFFLLHWNKSQTTKQNEAWSLTGEFLENIWEGASPPCLPSLQLFSTPWSRAP